VALNEGLRCKKRLWREAGRAQLGSFQLAPWASRRRRDLLELLDRLSPTIAELTQAIEQEVKKCPEAQRLTNAFSKKIENLAAMVAIHAVHYNFARIHKTLRITPAMAAGLSDHVWSLEESVLLANYFPSQKCAF
jgi:hypothetical protein